MATRVGFIGLGNIGKPMAINVAKAGFDLMVYDLREEPCQELAAAGAKIARSSGEVAAHGEIIEIVVVDDAQVAAVMLNRTTEDWYTLVGAILVIAHRKAAHSRANTRFAPTQGAEAVSQCHVV